MEPTESTPPVADHSPAIKRLARDLRILVYVQIAVVCAVICIFALLALAHVSKMMPDGITENTIRLLCGLLVGACLIIFVTVSLWSGVKLMGGTFLPIGIRRYGLGVWLLLPFVGLGVCLLNGEAPVLEMICICIFPLYCIVPQFFIARWLSKKAKDGAT